MRKIGIIAAVSDNGVIGIDGKLPFNYPEDMNHFKTITSNSIVIMGRNTFESIGRPLPKRRNIIISKKMSNTEGVEICASLNDALELCKLDNRDIWFIGGASIYEEAMYHSNIMLLTITSDIIVANNTVKFPWINPLKWKLTNESALENAANKKLFVVTYNLNN